MESKQPVNLGWPGRAIASCSWEHRDPGRRPALGSARWAEPLCGRAWWAQPEEGGLLGQRLCHRGDVGLPHPATPDSWEEARLVATLRPLESSLPGGMSQLDCLLVL